MLTNGAATLITICDRVSSMVRRVAATPIVENAWARVHRHHTALKAGLEGMGLKFLVKEGYQIPQMNAVLCPEGVNEGLEQLRAFDVDALVVIGGDGSFRGAWELCQRGFPVAGIPGTIDNDIAGTDATIGFDTAANTALEAVVRLRDTASSHERLFIVEVMGRGSGYLALYVGVSGGAELVVVPEVPFDVDKICARLHYGRKRGKTHSLIVLAEGVMPAHELAAKLQDTGGYDARITVLGHIQRGGGPTAADAVLASRMGAHAVEALLAGERGFMVGSVNNVMMTAPLPVAWESKKELPPALLALVDTLSI